jgi:hypothetical protein
MLGLLAALGRLPPLVVASALDALVADASAAWPSSPAASSSSPTTDGEFLVSTTPTPTPAPGQDAVRR